MGRRKSKIQHIVVVSDLHAGCRVALHPPGRLRLDDGGYYEPSDFQSKMYKMWRQFHDEFVPSIVGNDDYVLVCNGDAIDGHHHGTKTQISTNVVDQRRVAKALLEPEILKRNCRAYYHIRGTEAHVGQSAENEETLAEILGAKQDGEGRYSRWRAKLDLCGYLVDFLHHVGATGSQAYEASAVHKEMVESMVEAGRWNKRVPDVLVRSHRHRSIQTRIPVGWAGEAVEGQACKEAICVVTPCWQGKTPFVYKIPGGRLSDPQFGGIVISVKNARLDVRSWVQSLTMDHEEFLGEEEL